MDLPKLFDIPFNQVLIEESSSSVRKLVLNRPKKLNSLTLPMVSEMWKVLQSFESNPTIKLVILKGNGKAFCAGGDVVKAIEYMSGHWSFTAFFYKKQLMLDYYLATYKKPLVVLIHGMVMGGGAGISMHVKFRIVTEKTVFAMPEASIGLFPDVGASYFLSRLPGFFGEYLGLTGARIDGAEMVACGLATHFVYSKDITALENAFSELANPDIPTITAVINKFSQKPILKHGSIITRLEKINRCFSGKTVEEIVVSLDNEADNWIDKAKKSIKAASPLSLKLTLRSIREGRTQDLAQCLSREYRIVCQILLQSFEDNNFIEGSRAKLFDKDNKPKWKPSKLELVTDKFLDGYFMDPEIDEDWTKMKLPETRASTFMAKL
ncbi:hypothetical protein V2J09_008212 [Rumex salicifolius]